MRSHHSTLLQLILHLGIGVEDLVREEREACEGWDDHVHMELVEVCGIGEAHDRGGLRGALGEVQLAFQTVHPQGAEQPQQWNVPPTELPQVVQVRFRNRQQMYSPGGIFVFHNETLEGAVKFLEVRRATGGDNGLHKWVPAGGLDVDVPQRSAA